MLSEIHDLGFDWPQVKRKLAIRVKSSESERNNDAMKDLVQWQIEDTLAQTDTAVATKIEMLCSCCHSTLIDLRPEILTLL